MMQQLVYKVKLEIHNGDYFVILYNSSEAMSVISQEGGGEEHPTIMPTTFKNFFNKFITMFV